MVFLILFFGVFFGVFLLVLLLLVLPRPAIRDTGARPRVSILIAARNEEATIERCLQALEQLNYPAELLEILIGDDASTDNTLAVVQAFIQDKPQFRLLPIRHRLGTSKGKSNVLAHLCRAATSDYFLFTDADMALAPDWVQTMLGAAPEGVGIVTGITTAEGNLFGRLQGLDWLFGLSLIRVLTDLGLPITAVGNNMLVTRAAYESIGGYEALAFSITEDLQLFEQVVGQGWGFRNIITPQALGVSVPQPTVQHLLRQRKRWMKGAGRLPWQLGLLFSSYGFFYTVLGWPSLLPLPAIAALYTGKVLCQTLFLLITLRQAGWRENLGVLLLYDVYLLLMSVAALAYTAWPSFIHWKERRYRWAEV
ncbi:Glycosyltransferase, catalytic subunit of cellulose synthase and poly-beta-1,6-N-acetylglucosamine synthase [Hymenobacter gelipurpurascens]|uniref:Glycosyltransferase, catalytic subunit of cellulose synthase and poly-beta-1,6-N-acetylglucosamine synthase n=1 Tax=Hymenobacter gelipurpurascens TaxID=89968 RepID=A0A212UFA1_9BACT|nr:glycosyltransferase [Hymenobacter gelipurpurascens]SNC76935.1 Glycosyltransferase, catalytic subunit of cellulose synthase and poly-beta-1,6-N-acetylglucosamine synthase [Hymenobacter gelipurpurascens]